MKRTFVKFSFLLLLITAIACNNNREQSASGSHEEQAENAEERNDEKFDDKDLRNDADFVSDQVSMNYAEVELARLATQKSNNQEVKRIAQNLIAAHEKTNKELASFASKKAITIPSAADDSDLKGVNDLRDEKDMKDFNKDWCDKMVDHHEKAIKDFEDRMQNTEDPDLKTWINNTLPGLRTHLEELKTCQNKLKNS